jgi:predicted CxxxxCH...CXXCH cytochrome family protein
VSGLAMSAGNHPRAGACERCHGSVVSQGREFAHPERHVDGNVDADELVCTSCHGSGASPAPPTDLTGNMDVAALGVGAHQAHMNGSSSSRPVPCSECHVVPEEVDAPSHIDDWSIAEVTFSGAASARNSDPSWNRQSGRCTNSWCHGADRSVTTSPVWTDSGVSLSCTSCHGLPPPAPHVQLPQCNLCHSNTRVDGSFVDRNLHVNGVVDF